MTTVFEPAAVQPSTSPTQRMRATMVAARVAISWLGVRKTLNSEQRSQAAETFGAEGGFLSAGKKLLDTRHPAFQAVTAVRNRTVKYWKGLSLPYPEPGVRLIRRNTIEVFESQMAVFREELADAVADLNDRYEHLKATAQRRLGSLYDSRDYPASLAGLFTIDWEYPSVEPPDYLREVHPEVYERECERVMSRFEEAVQLAEQTFMDELQQLVAHLTERLTGQTDGKPKVFRDSAVGNLTEFFERFRKLNVRSNDELDQLVGQCRDIISGVDAQTLRDHQGIRQQVAGELQQVGNVLDSLLVDRPRRSIMRRPKGGSA